MKLKLRKPSNLIIVVLLAIVFFLATASFNYLSQTKNYVKWTSPDETANYFFAKKFALSGELAYFDSAAIIGDNMVHPRSFRSDFGWLKPVSFLGIILLYGAIASLLGIAVIPFLTPFLAALGIIVFYLLIKKIFNDRIALISAFLLATFPVYVYYSVRSMFHNVLFIVLLIFAVYCLLLALNKGRKKEKFLSLQFKFLDWRNLFLAFLAGILLGLAIITRTSELLWLAPVLFVTWLFYFKRIGLIKLILLLAGLLLALIPVIYWNQVLYSAPIYGGYNEMNRSLDDISRSSDQMLKSIWQGNFSNYSSYLTSLKKNIFYFGFKPQQSLSMFGHYVVEMFPILFYLFLIGLVILIGQNISHFRKRYLFYILIYLLLSTILVFYYGSWKFNDNPNLSHFTIGNSYTRYWLPIYLMMIPLASLAITRLTKALLMVNEETKNRLKSIIVNGLQAIIVLIISASSIIFVLFGSEEGLVYLYYNNKLEKTIVEKVFTLTEPQSVIITRYYDKFFFPERRVIVDTLPNKQILTTSAKLLSHYPVYYYNFYLRPQDVDYLNTRKLKQFNLHIKLIDSFNTNFGLYQLNIKKNE